MIFDAHFSVRSITRKRAVHAEAGCAHADSSPEPTAVNNGDIAVR